MMMRFTQTILALLLLLVPAAATAQYMTPEDVLQSEDSAFLVPTLGRRGAQYADELQREQNRERHPSIVSEPGDSPWSDAVPPPTQGQLVPTDSTVGIGTSGGQQVVVDPVTARILARLLAREELQGGYLPSTAGYKDAPLTGSGPASVIAILTLIPATVWTLRRARMLEKFVREA